MHLVLPPPEPTETPPISGISQGSMVSGQTAGSTLFAASNLNSTNTTSTSIRSSATASGNNQPANAPSYIASNQFTRVPTPHSQRTAQQSTTPSQTVPGTCETDNSETSRQMHAIRTQIEHIERGLDYAIIPPIEHVIRLRTQLLEFQDRQPASWSPSTGVEELISRILHIQQRTRIQEAMQQQLQTNIPIRDPLPRTTTSADPTHTVSTGTNEEDVQFFMVTSPRGENSIIVNSLETQIPPTHAIFSPNPAARIPGANTLPPPYPNAGVAQNAIRQAIANQQRRANNIEHIGLARHIRRIWLFARLWCFCYLLSAPGTWRRYIFVSISLLITFLSETDIPQQILHLVIDPMQRHLDGLAHIGGPADPAAQNGGNDAAAGLGLWDIVCRIERSLVLLFASLVPGLGERQVQARTAADQAHRAEQERLARARQEEQDASNRQEQEQEQTQEQGLGESERSGNADNVQTGQS